MKRYFLLFTALAGLVDTSSTAAQKTQQAPPNTVATVSGVDTPSDPGPHAGVSALQQERFRYRLHRGDAFDITFPYTPEFNQTVTIQPDGYISLASVGTVHVEGKTVPELTTLICAKYAAILHDPVINIVLKDFEKPFFIASGSVARPGKYELRSDTTMTEGVAIAGGFTEDSKHSAVFLFRRVANNWVELKRVDVKQMFKKADLTEDVHLQPGDMLFVPQNRYSKFKRYIPSPGIGVMTSY
jgi:polysaccharide biosynthesis/export protein